MPVTALNKRAARPGAKAAERAGAAAIRSERAAVDARAPTPLYHQVYVILRERIRNGSHRPGTRIPSEQKLAAAFGVSRITVKRAVDQLAAEGLVARHRGRGTTVLSRLETPPVQGSLNGLLENLLAMGLKTGVEVVDFAYERPPEEVRRALAHLEGEEVQKAVRVRSLDGEPFSYLTTYVPAEIGRSFGRRDLARSPLLSLLERCGVEVTSAEQTITATLADTDVARHLGVGVGAPLLSLTRVVRDQHGRPVEYINVLYRPDRYRYHMRLSRVQGEARNLWSPAA